MRRLVSGKANGDGSLLEATGQGWGAGPGEEAAAAGRKRGAGGEWQSMLQSDVKGLREEGSSSALPTKAHGGGPVSPQSEVPSLHPPQHCFKVRAAHLCPGCQPAAVQGREKPRSQFPHRCSGHRGAWPARKMENPSQV